MFNGGHGSVCQRSLARKLCKLTVAIEWGVTQIRTCKPQSPEEMRQAAEVIRDKLQAKGCSAKAGTMPGHLKKALESMMAKADALVAPVPAAAVQGPVV